MESETSEPWPTDEIDYEYSSYIQPASPKDYSDQLGRQELPEDYYRNPCYHKGSSYVIRLYLQCSSLSYWLLNDVKYFIIFMTAVILFAGIMVGIETYPNVIDSKLVTQLDILILALFILEMLIKVSSKGLRPWRYFTGQNFRSNMFDFIIIVLSLYLLVAQSVSSSYVAFLRIIRLLRLGKLISYFPAFQLVIAGLSDGLLSIAPIALLLFIIFYAYAILGFYLFSENDPFHFGNLGLSMITLLRVSLYDNDGDIMYINMFGCDVYPDVYFRPTAGFSNYTNTTNINFLPAINSTGSSTNTSKSGSGSRNNIANQILICSNPLSQPIVSPIYFVSFIVVTAFVVLSLFFGAITSSMIDSHKRIEQESKIRVAQLKVTQKTSQVTSAGLEFNDERPNPPRPTFCDLVNKYSTGSHGSIAIYNYSRAAIEFLTNSQLFSNSTKLAELDILIIHAGMGSSLAVAMGWKDNYDDDNFHRAPTEYVKMFSKHTDNIRRKPLLIRMYIVFVVTCRKFIHSRIFTGLVLSAIFISLVNIGLATDYRIMADPNRALAVEGISYFVVFCFGTEVLVRLGSYGIHPISYFHSFWNMFDLFIVVCTLVPATHSAVTILRILYLTRVFKLIRGFPQLQVILSALSQAFASVGYLVILLCLFFYSYAILGLTLFGSNDPWHYGSLHVSFLSLFRAVTYETTFGVMYISQYGCDVYQDIYSYAPLAPLCSNPYAFGWWAVVYTLVLIFVGGQILVTLFVGIVSSCMESSHESRLLETQFEVKMKERETRLKLSSQRTTAFHSAFDCFDWDNDGKLDQIEFKKGLVALGISLIDIDLDERFEIVDPDMTGIEITSFIDFMGDLPCYVLSAGTILGQWNNDISTHSSTISDSNWRRLCDCFLNWSHTVVEARRHEAALIIQLCWLNFCIRKSHSLAMRETNVPINLQTQTPVGRLS